MRSLICGPRGVLAVMAVIGSCLASSYVAAQNMEPAQTPWSGPVGGLEARLLLARREIQSGTPLIAVRIELRDVRGTLGELRLPWSQVQWRWHVTDLERNALRPASIGWSGPSASRVDIVVPEGATLSFELTDRGRRAGPDHAAMIVFDALDAFVIPDDGKEYFLSGTMTMWGGNATTSRATWFGSIPFPPVRIPVRDDPLPPAPSASVIDELGAQMLDWRNRRAADAAMRELSLIDDDRVERWYLEALRTHDTLVPRALDGLSRFNSDAALSAIESAMTASDGNARHVAAIALSLSPHPKARELLWTMIDDPRQALRMVVVRAAGKAASIESRAVLEHALNDSDDTVRREARRLLDEFRPLE